MDNKNAQVGIKFNDKDKAEVQAAADKLFLPISVYIRSAAMLKAKEDLNK